MDIHRTPPHSVEAEQGVLSSMLISPCDAIAECVEKINEEYFYVPAHQTIYTVLVELWNAGEAIDLITFTQVLRDRNLLEGVGGAAFVTSLFTFVPTAANVGYYIDIVRDKYLFREIIAASTENVRRAYEKQNEEVSNLLDEVEGRIVTIRGHNGNLPGGLPPTEDGAALISQQIVLPDDVIKGMLHRCAKMVCGGASKAFKTWTFIDAAASVATGTDWLGKFSTKRGRVLYINLELQGGFFAKRLATVCDERQLKIEPGYLTVWNLRGHAADLSKLLSRLLRRISRDQFVLIIIDPIYKLLGARDENKAGDIATLLNEIELLAVKTGAAVLFGAHYSKGNQSAKESVDRIGGSGVFARDPDTILNFTRHEQDDCFTVEATLRNHPPIEPFVVRWDYPLFCVASELDPEQLKKVGRPEKYSAKDLLPLIDEPMGASEIAKKAWSKLKIRERRVYELLAELKDCDLLRQPKKRGLYELA